MGGLGMTMIGHDAQTMNLLLVDDDPAIIRVTSRLLGDLGRCRFARSASDALRLLRTEPVDLVLLDAEMPGMSGLDLLRLMKRSTDLADIPVVLLTSRFDEETEEAALAAGAADFMAKPIRAGVLRARVGLQLRLREALARVVQLARTDPLTGLANRRAMQERLDLDLARVERSDSPISVLLLDVDHFKRFNDQYGHPAGDRALQAVAQAVRGTACRATDLAGRWGGEEFLVSLPGADEKGAMAVADALHAKLKALAIPHEGSTVAHLSVSIGAAVRPSGANVAAARREASYSPQLEVERLVSLADAALYEAKSRGRNGTVLRTVPLVGRPET